MPEDLAIRFAQVVHFGMTYLNQPVRIIWLNDQPLLASTPTASRLNSSVY
jgi:hypothetical protein